MADQERWLEWAMRLQTIAAAGLEFGADPYDLERYETIRQIAVELIADHVVDAELTTIDDLFPDGHGYLTPKVDVRALVVDAEQRVLLVRNAGSGRWSLPGGFADLGEAPTECAEREVEEETGYRVKADRLLALLDADHHRERALRWSFWQVVIVCDLVSGNPRPSLETTEVGWFGADALPDLDQRSPASVVALALAARATGDLYCD